MALWDPGCRAARLAGRRDYFFEGGLAGRCHLQQRSRARRGRQPSAARVLVTGDPRPGLCAAARSRHHAARQDLFVGHSAGGQFAHRLLATQPPGIFEAVGAANSGWYTLPTLDLHYPDGLGGIGLTRDDVVRLLGYPLAIFSGEQDIDGTAENFPKHDAAMAQGSNRFARAQFYIDRGRAEASKLGVPCCWSRIVVPGVAHEGMRMSAFASDYRFGAKDRGQAADADVAAL
jgi:hypothetical protein